MRAQSRCTLMYYNFVRLHQTLRKVSPAMAAGVTNRLWEMVTDVVDVLDAFEAKR